MQIQNRYQKELDRLEKENKDLRKQLMFKELKSGHRKRRMKVCTVMPTKRDNDLILYLQLLSKKTKVYTSLELTLMDRSLLY